MTRWRRLEDYAVQYHNVDSEFDVEDYALAVGIDTAEGTLDIQAYLEAQRRPNSPIKYPLHRKPGTRTATAVWLVGDRARDARQVGDGLFSDFKTRILRAFQPDLALIAKLNPRAMKRVDLQLDAVIKGILPLLKAAVLGEGLDDDDDE